VTAGLDARFGVRVDEFELAVELAVGAGGLVALVGPNGAGKTTLLRALAGLLPVDRGRIALDGVVLDDPGSDVFVPPERRAVAVVFQDGLLFPHLSALENVAFGLRSRGAARAIARVRAAEWLARVDLADRAGAKPAQLSGGQQQRVALARALVTEPRLLLLDEPLAALDASTRTQVRRELRHHLDAYDGVRIVVTHDPLEALSLADHLVVLEGGTVVQRGTPDDVRRRPRSRYVADLVGLNLVIGTVAGAVLTTASGAALHVANPDALVGAAVAVVHPRAVALHASRPDGSPRNVWSATVTDLDQDGDRLRCRTSGPIDLVAEITVAARDDLGLAPGCEVWVSVKASEVDVHPQ
jgi:molybdate transport system ATP-binding protein